MGSPMHNKMASTPLIRDASVIVPRVRDGREWQRDKVHDQINYTAINQTRENRAAHDNRDPQARYIECGRPNKRNRVMHDHAEHDRRPTDSKTFRANQPTRDVLKHPSWCNPAG